MMPPHESAGNSRQFLFGSIRAWVTLTTGPGSEPALVVPEHAIAKTVLLGGAGIGRLPEYHARGAIADGTLVRILPDHESERVDAYALYPRHRSLSAKVRVFVEAVTAHLATK